MRIHLPRLGLNAWCDLQVDELELLAAQDTFGVHELVVDPDEADAVLFVQCHMVDWRLRAIRSHPVARSHWDRVMVYDERDRPWRSFPGVYVSMPASTFDSRSQRAWSYLRVPSEPPESREPDLLFSFIGQATAPCRRQLFELRHPDAIVEEVTDFMFWDSSSANYAERTAHFRDVLARSRFVLCPRGAGTSSFRLYETLAAGRVPVILADEWVAPIGPRWETFSLRVPESGSATIIALLEARAGDWESMSAAAMATYNLHFGRTALFHRLAELVAQVDASSPDRDGASMLGTRSIASAVRESRSARRRDAA